MLEKLLKKLGRFGEAVEVVLALCVAVCIVIAIIGYVPRFGAFWEVRGTSGAFSEMLSGILTIVVGAEFLKMLCRPSMDSVTEVLIFVIARHMIVEQTSATDDLLAVISIVLLFSLKKLLFEVKTRSGIAKRIAERFTGRTDSDAARQVEAAEDDFFGEEKNE